MTLIDSIRRTVNYGTTTVTQTVHKIAANPKKALQLSVKIFAAVDLYQGRSIQKRRVTEAMKGTVDLMDGYGSFKNICFWLNLFSKESMDQNSLLDSLKEKLGQDERAGQVFDAVMAKAAYYSKGEVRKEIKVKLLEKGEKPDVAETIANEVLIKQKSHPMSQLLIMACFTVADLGTNLMTLKDWEIWDLTQLSTFAARMGTQSPVFAYIIKLGAETTLKTVASVGLTLALRDACYRTYKYRPSYLTQNPQEDRQEFKKGVLDLFSTVTDLVATAAPLIFVVSPAMVVAFAIVSKGTGLVCLVMR